MSRFMDDSFLTLVVRQFTFAPEPHAIGHSPLRPSIAKREGYGPISRDIVDLWKKRQLSNNKPPQRIDDPEKYSFFDPLTGEPRAWYWRSESGNYEFYDNQGFHPRTGEALLVITREVNAKWKQEMEAARQKKLRDDLEMQKRTEREEQKQREGQEMERQAATLCDQLAANPGDRLRQAPGVPYDQLNTQFREAIDACTRAVAQYPNELRFRYQLGRALEFTDRTQALVIHTKLVKLKYPAAFDNLGSMLLRDKNNQRAAIQLFREGWQRGDPDSMVSLANMIQNGYDRPPPNPIDLLKTAADLGHQGALQAYNAYFAKQQQFQQQRLGQQESQRQMLNFFGNLLQNIRRF